MVFLIRRILDSCIFISFIAGIIFFTGYPCPASPTKQPPAAEEFPIYGVIQPNVDFWIDIFTRYSKTDGVLHDAWDLSRIYEVLKLNPARTRKAAKQNRQIKEKARNRHKAALLQLAKGRPPATPLEKKVAAILGKTTKKQFKRAAYNLRVQTGLKNQFKEGIIRSGALMDEFKRIFLSHGLPSDLLCLPSVESSFNTAAYSKFGAAGIWQFTRSTGKIYMDIGYVVDERRDPFIATQGAARLLKRNFKALGSWPRAITAYNHGLNGMKRAKKKHKTYPRIYTDYRGRSFKFASRNFYSEFLAAREVGKNYTRYFGNITLDRPVKNSRFTVQGFIPAPALARSLNLDMTILKKMNPALRKPVFNGRKYIPKGFELRLPKEMSPARIAQAAAPLYRDRQKPSKFHRVRKGDTAGRIAKTHKVALNDLILANGLGRQAVIYIGQTLRIPAQKETISIKTALAKTVLPLPQQPNDPIEIYPAKLRYSEPQAKPMAADTKINLKIVTSDLKIQKMIQNKKYQAGIIHVAPEETLGHYANWLGINTQKIRNLNRLPFGQSISIGQAIKIPLPISGSAEFEEHRYEFHQEILEDFFDSFFVAATRNYKIKSGDTTWNLCTNELEIPLWLLEKFNPAMDFNKLQTGQIIVYPQVHSNGINSNGVKS